MLDNLWSWSMQTVKDCGARLRVKQDVQVTLRDLMPRMKRQCDQCILKVISLATTTVTRTSFNTKQISRSSTILICNDKTCLREIQSHSSHAGGATSVSLALEKYEIDATLVQLDAILPNEKFVGSVWPENCRCQVPQRHGTVWPLWSCQVYPDDCTIFEPKEFSKCLGGVSLKDKQSYAELFPINLQQCLLPKRSSWIEIPEAVSFTNFTKIKTAIPADSASGQERSHRCWDVFTELCSPSAWSRVLPLKICARSRDALPSLSQHALTMHSLYFLLKDSQQAKEAFFGTASNQHGVEQCNIPTQLRVLCDKVSVQCQKWQQKWQT